jgi:CheY-like chemotaxis protein
MAIDDIRPAIALIDLGMPRMNGLELVRRLRQHPLGPSMRIIALSGWGQAQDRARSSDAGFDVHVVKPVDVTTLVALLSGTGCG